MIFYTSTPQMLVRLVSSHCGCENINLGAHSVPTCLPLRPVKWVKPSEPVNTPIMDSNALETSSQRLNKELGTCNNLITVPPAGKKTKVNDIRASSKLISNPTTSLHFHAGCLKALVGNYSRLASQTLTELRLIVMTLENFELFQWLNLVVQNAQGQSAVI